MSDRTNTIFGWILFSGIVALILRFFSSLIYADHGAPEVAGFPIEAAEEGGGGEQGPSLATLLANADPAQGEKTFAKCVSCHTIAQGAPNGIGPNLYGVVGEGIGVGAGGFAFSDALKSHGGEWTYENLDHWLTSPRGFANGTLMSFAGLSKPEARANVIAFLVQNGGGPAFPEPEAPAEAVADGGDAAATAEAPADEAAAAGEEAAAE